MATRLHILSDLHLERSDWEPSSPPDVDVVVLAGDVHPGLEGLKWARAAYGDLPIVFVPGNHEFHRHRLRGLWERMRDWGRSQNIHVLEQETVEVEGVRFFGATLWTDFRLFGEEKHQAVVDLAAAEMSDYDRIRHDDDGGDGDGDSGDGGDGGGRMLCPRDTEEMNRRTREWLAGEAEKGNTKGAVIVTHHAPSERCLKPGRRDDKLSACYASHHEELVSRSGAALWVYGHTHWSMDFRLDGVRVLSNQRGYPGEDNNGFDPRLVLEV